MGLSSRSDKTQLIPDNPMYDFHWDLRFMRSSLLIEPTFSTVVVSLSVPRTRTLSPKASSLFIVLRQRRTLPVHLTPFELSSFRPIPYHIGHTNHVR